MYRLPGERKTLSRDPITLAFRRNGWAALRTRARRQGDVLWRTAGVAYAEGRLDAAKACATRAMRRWEVADRCERFRHSIPFAADVA